MEKKKKCLKNPQNPQQAWQIDYEDILGEGAFAKVFKGKESLNGNVSDVAVKVQDISNVKKLVGDRWETILERELLISQKANCENLVQTRYTLQKGAKNPNNGEYGIKELFIIMELCDRENLKQKLKTRIKFPEEEAKYIFKQIFKGLSWIVSQKGIHRDLKPENILFKDGIPKIADFGLSRIDFIQGGGNQQITVTGTLQYRPPELQTSRDYIDQIDDPHKIDIWSLGLIFYEMLYGKLPWSAENIQSDNEFYTIVKKVPLIFPNDTPVSPEAQDLIKNMLKVDQKQRYSFHQCSSHPYMKE